MFTFMDNYFKYSWLYIFKTFIPIKRIYSLILKIIDLQYGVSFKTRCVQV